MPGGNETRRRLVQMGFQAVAAPVLKIRPLPATIDLAGVGALAFTSANAVFAFAGDARDLPVFAVGDGTARAARAAGFAEVVSAKGDVAALARAIADRAGELKGAVLHPAAAAPAGDLAGDLVRAGIPARSVAVYETVDANFPSLLLDLIAECDGVLIHSPKAARRVAELLPMIRAPRLRAWCLSSAVAAPLAGFDIGPIIVAPLPTEDALLSLVAETGP